MAKSAAVPGYLLKSQQWAGFSIQTYSDGTYGYTNPRESARGFADFEGAKAAAEALVRDGDNDLRIRARNAAEEHLAGYISTVFAECAQEIDDQYGAWARKTYKEDAGTRASRAQVRDLTATLARMASRATEMTVQYIDGYVPQVMSDAANITEYTLEDGTTLNPMFALVDTDSIMALASEHTVTIPTCVSDTIKTYKWDAAKIRDALTRSIAMGESIDKCAKRLQGVVDSNKAVATRNARTMVTAAMSAGDVIAYKRAATAGIKIKIQWLAALDDRTRHSHRVCDGEIRAIGEKFSNGLRWPGDVDGPAAELMNCRCTTVPIINDTEYTGKRAEKLNGMSYDEWKANQRPAPKPTGKSAGAAPKPTGKSAGAEVKPTDAPAPEPEQPRWPLIDPDSLDEAAKAKRDTLAREVSSHYRAFSRLPNGESLLLPAREYGQYVASVPKMRGFSQKEDEELAESTIRSLLADADESVARRMYRDYLAGASVLNNSIGGAYYKPSDAQVRMSLKTIYLDTESDPKGNTLFHECGHWLDHQLAGGETSKDDFCPYISDGLERTMLEDWVAWRDARGREWVADWDEYKSEEDKNTAVISRLCEQHPRGTETYIEWGDVSDMIESVTLVPYPLYMGHGLDYYDSLPHACSEFFAEYMSAQITNPKSLARIREIFPHACEQLDAKVAARLDELDAAYAARMSNTSTD